MWLLYHDTFGNIIKSFIVVKFSRLYITSLVINLYNKIKILLLNL